MLSTCVDAAAGGVTHAAPQINHEWLEGTTMFSPDDITLLDQPAFAKLATRMSDGVLQNTVMWYRREHDTLRMIAPAASVKARNLLRDPRCAVVIDDPDNGYRYIELRGRAEVIQDDRAARDELRRIAERYIGDLADAYVASLSAAPRVLIVVHVERMRSHAGQPPRPATAST
jgi:PPOX class probable F420-dependent enzyme